MERKLQQLKHGRASKARTQQKAKHTAGGGGGWGQLQVGQQPRTATVPPAGHANTVARKLTTLDPGSHATGNRAHSRRNPKWKEKRRIYSHKHATQFNFLKHALGAAHHISASWACHNENAGPYIFHLGPAPAN